MSLKTRQKRSLFKTGKLNYWYGKTLHKINLDAAVELKGTKFMFIHKTVLN